MRVGVGRVGLDLRRRLAVGQCIEHFAGRLLFGGEDLQQPRGGVDAVVEAVPALAEEEVAAHLTGKLGLGLANLRLDQRMTGLPHQRAAAVALDVAGPEPGALDVEQEPRPRVAFDTGRGETPQQAVGYESPARGGYPAVGSE